MRGFISLPVPYPAGLTLGAIPPSSLSFRLLTALPPVAIAAEHLAVGGNRSSAFYPRGDMVGFHDFDVKRFAADCALAALSFIDLTARVRIKSADTQMVDVAVQDISEDAGFLLHIGVRHQFSHLLAD